MRKTCYECPNLKLNNTRSMVVAYCGARDKGPVIPHASDLSDDETKWDLTFWRVPMECPLPDTEVLKSEKRAPVKDWKEDSVERK